MKKLNLTTVLALVVPVLVLLACSSVKKTDELSDKAHISGKSMLPDSIYRFTVSFISIGSGIDHKAREEFNAFIQQYNAKHNVSITTENASWGREGEIDYCMRLQELTTAQEHNFITETKEILKSSSRVRYQENSTCRQSRRSENK